MKKRKKKKKTSAQPLKLSFSSGHKTLNSSFGMCFSITPMALIEAERRTGGQKWGAIKRFVGVSKKC